MSAIEELLKSPSLWTFIVLVLFHLWWRKPHSKFPPLVRGLPGLGVLPYLDNYPQKIFKKWSLKMKEPVISVRIGSTEAVVVNTYNAAVQVGITIFLNVYPIFVFVITCFEMLCMNLIVFNFFL